MKQCPVIQDLLPLYVDDALSPESRALADQHLADCPDCRQALAALRAGGPSVAVPVDLTASDEVRWITRLKRQVGTIVGVLIVLLVGIPVVPIAYLGWRGEREKDRAEQAYMQAQKQAIEAILATNPDPLARLRTKGVSISSTVQHEGNRVEVDYTLHATGPAEVVYPFTHGPVAIPRLINPANGNVIGRYTQGGSGHSPGEPVQGELIFDDVATLPADTELQLPYLMVYMRPEQELKWDFRRTGKNGEVALGHRFTVAGVEFEVERIRFEENWAEIDYHQVTPQSQVGVHLLSFHLSDRMGGTWSEQPLLEHLPDPMQPRQHFSFVTSLSKNWTLQVQHAVLTLPGPIIPLEVR